MVKMIISQVKIPVVVLSLFTAHVYGSEAVDFALTIKIYGKEIGVDRAIESQCAKWKKAASQLPINASSLREIQGNCLWYGFSKSGDEGCVIVGKVLINEAPLGVYPYLYMGSCHGYYHNKVTREKTDMSPVLARQLYNQFEKECAESTGVAGPYDLGPAAATEPRDADVDVKKQAALTVVKQDKELADAGSGHVDKPAITELTQLNLKVSFKCDFDCIGYKERTPDNISTFVHQAYKENGSGTRSAIPGEFRGYRVREQESEKLSPKEAAKIFSEFEAAYNKKSKDDKSAVKGAGKKEKSLLARLFRSS